MPIVDATDARWFLTALDGAREGTVWPIRGNVTIGRRGEILVEDRHVSREHLLIRAGDRVRARRCGKNMCYAGRRRIPATRWLPLRAGTVIHAGERFRLDERPRRRSKAPWIVAGTTLLVALILPFLASGPAWRWAFLLVPAMLLSQVFRRKARRLKPLRSPLAILVSSHEGRSFHSEPHLPTRSLRGDLAGTGWAVRSEAAAIWLAGYLAVWNDPDILSVTSPWVTTRGTGIEIVFGPAPPTRDAVAITWGQRPQWALPLRIARRHAGTAAWAAHLRVTTDLLPVQFTLEQALECTPGDGLAVHLAHGVEGKIIVDLSEAPHALVAGTTGSGKSELLTSWLLLMASQRAPSELIFVIMDFKGGATSGVLHGLPHLVDAVTDLDAAAARRVVTSLRATLQARERILATHGARDIHELRDPPPRLVVVVDEFRALADDVPDALDQLVRLAAQGRSLGVHLILATQRPGGVVTADMRANLPLRFALRTSEAADSHDLIGTDESARLPRIPGRAVLLDGAPRTVQIAWDANPRATVAAIAHRWGRQRPDTPWLPPLPLTTTIEELGGGIALIDRPDDLTREVMKLPHRHILITGPHGSGLSTAAQTCASVAVLEGEETWLVSGAPWVGECGPSIAPNQTRLVLRAISDAQSRAGRVIIDDVEAWAAVHDSLHGPGAADQVLHSLLRSQARAVLLTREIAPRWGRDIAQRVHLAGRDRTAAALSGLPRPAQEILESCIPGRAVVQGLAAQFALPHTAPLPRPNPTRGLVPLPESVPLREVAGAVVLGHDGDHEIRIHPGSIAVVGPRGSGLTETALMIASQVPGATILESPQPGVVVPSGPVIATATPDAWAGAFGGVLGNLKTNAPLLILRPDLCPRVAPGIERELEPGSPGYAILLNGSAVNALRLARIKAAVDE